MRHRPPVAGRHPGSGIYTCYHTMPQLWKNGNELMRLDKTWIAWRDARMNKKPFTPEQMDIGYRWPATPAQATSMATPKRRAVITNGSPRGPHAMVVVPDPSRLEGLPTDPNNGVRLCAVEGNIMFTSWCPLARAREPDSKLKRKATSLHSGLLAGCRDVSG
jgi:hypothetical protein